MAAFKSEMKAQRGDTMYSNEVGDIKCVFQPEQEQAGDSKMGGRLISEGTTFKFELLRLFS